MADKIQVSASELHAWYEDGEDFPAGLETLLIKAVDMIKEDMVPNVVLGSIVIVNDFEPEEEESEDEESEVVRRNRNQEGSLINV